RLVSSRWISSACFSETSRYIATEATTVAPRLTASITANRNRLTLRFIPTAAFPAPSAISALPVRPQPGGVGALAAGIDLGRHLGVGADPRRDDLAERSPARHWPRAGIPQLGAHDRAGAVEVAVLDVHARGQQRRLAERAEPPEQLRIVVDLGCPG